MWNRADVDFIHTQELPWVAVPSDEFGATGLQKILSIDKADGAKTAIVDFRSPQKGKLAAGADIYVLQGHGQLNGRAYGPGHYFHIPPQTFIDFTPGLPRTSVYAGFFGSSTLVDDAGSSDGVTHIDTERIPYTPPEWNGERPLNPGAHVKWVRRDPDAEVYMAAMLPGWTSDLEEAHPVYEESFKLYGDILMGSRGVMRAGSYFFRGPNVFHGPLYSRGGTMSFIRSSAAITTDYREPAKGGTAAELARRAYADRPHPAL